MNKDLFNKENLEIIDEIINLEWEMFQKVENIGGRASCQNDYETFFIMRFSQYGSWDQKMIEAYLDFVKSCQRSGRNLVSEKYARMMKYTNPEYYEKELSAYLPEVSYAQRIFIDEIVLQMIIWEKAFSDKYPKLSAASRPISSEEDSKGFTSMETYARGELETYPLELLALYCEYIKKLKKNDKSLSVINQNIMVHLYGYESIEEAEQSI